jgi:hypothetical protein
MNTFTYNRLLYSLVCHIKWKNRSHGRILNESYSWPCCFSCHNGKQQNIEPCCSNRSLPAKGLIMYKLLRPTSTKKPAKTAGRSRSIVGGRSYISIGGENRVLITVGVKKRRLGGTKVPQEGPTHGRHVRQWWLSSQGNVSDVSGHSSLLKRMDWKQLSNYIVRRRRHATISK